MGVYSRYKKQQDGLDNVCALWESSSAVKRQKMIEVGMKEDPEYTKMALSNMLNFEDIIKVSDSILMEILEKAPAYSIANSLRSYPQQKDRFLKLAPARFRLDLKFFFDIKVSPAEETNAHMFFIKTARSIEKKHGLKIKRMVTSQ
jgi:flagellar motor switch protein FliG